MPISKIDLSQFESIKLPDFDKISLLTEPIKLSETLRNFLEITKNINYSKLTSSLHQQENHPRKTPSNI